MKVAITIIFIAASLFFVVGGAAAYAGWLSAQTYIVATGIVGGIASVVSLLALLAKPFTTKDIRTVEAGLLRELSDAVKAANEYEQRISSNKAEIGRLERERKEIEVLVRQTSLKVFLEERLKNIAHEIERKVSADPVLPSLIESYEEALLQVKEIDGLIEKSGKADLIATILENVPHRRADVYIKLGNISVNATLMQRVMDQIVKMLTH
jgi:hypothetical protein